MFAEMKIRSGGDLKLWKKQLPGIAHSIARHARTLSIGCPEFVVEADAEEGGWIRAFSSVESLNVCVCVNQLSTRHQKRTEATR